MTAIRWAKDRGRDLKATLELGLPNEHDLNQDLIIALQVGEHPDFFKGRVGKVLRLVDDQKNRAVLRNISR